MRSDARIASAIEILDDVLAGAPAERTLTNWARASRFAGSSDRAAVRDLVFGALRRRRSDGWLGGGDTGRGLMLGQMRRTAPDEATALFGASPYGAEAITAEEQARFRSLEDAPEAVRFDCPDWLWPVFQADYGDQAGPVLSALQDRAPVFLRVNQARISRDAVLAGLAAEDITALPVPLCDTAVQVTSGERRLRMVSLYRDGLIEFQDAASQAAVHESAQHMRGKRVLDYCAGGGGKALGFAALGGEVTAHDANPGRMKDLAERARQAGVKVPITTKPRGQFDLVFCDAPCSGSGAWRRQPGAKWDINQAGLDRLGRIQSEILDRAQHFVAMDGLLAYATCSLLRAENQAQIDAFCDRHPGWECFATHQWTPLDGADGFFLALLRRS